MPHGRSRRRAALAAMLALGLLGFTTGPAFGASDHKTVKAHDDCEPTSFIAALGDGACVGEGRTTFPEFGAEFGSTPGSVAAWFFDRAEFDLENGGVITAENEGGEAHSFTEVGRFGAGCVDELNMFAGDLATTTKGTPIDCATTFVGELIGPGMSSAPKPVMGAGTHRFQCLIHPWMRTVVTVEADDEDHSGEG